MKAAWFETFGPARKAILVGEQSKPVQAAGEVLVHLFTSGVNPSDVKKRAGAFPDLLDAGAVIPHSDGAGIIEAVGAGVSPKKIGERVWVYQAQYGRRFGTCAEYVAIEENRAAGLPFNTSFEIGACLGIPAMTAHRCVLADGDVAGQTLLVTGGAGRVGYYAVQWAKLAGAKVIATASNEDDRAVCLDLGADSVCNHRDEDWGKAALALNGGKKIDRVVDVEFGANLPQLLNCVRTGGTIATYASAQVKEPRLPFLQMMFMDLTVRMVLVYAMPEPAKKTAIADIGSALMRGSLQHRVANVLPLNETAQAHELVEAGGCQGCVVVATG